MCTSASAAAGARTSRSAGQLRADRAAGAGGDRERAVGFRARAPAPRAPDARRGRPAARRRTWPGSASKAASRISSRRSDAYRTSLEAEDQLAISRTPRGHGAGDDVQGVGRRLGDRAGRMNASRGGGNAPHPWRRKAQAHAPLRIISPTAAIAASTRVLLFVIPVAGGVGNYHCHHHVAVSSPGSRSGGRAPGCHVVGTAGDSTNAEHTDVAWRLSGGICERSRNSSASREGRQWQHPCAPAHTRGPPAVRVPAPLPRRIKPEDVGLPAASGRSRTGGLRREDVAALSGVSASWYTWLEQGRDIRVSDEVLERVSQTLRLSEDERTYLFSLVQHRPPRGSARRIAKCRPTWSAWCTPLLHARGGDEPALGRAGLERRCTVPSTATAARLRPNERNLLEILLMKPVRHTTPSSWSTAPRDA